MKKLIILAALATGLIGAQAYAFSGSIEFMGSASATQTTKKGVQTTTINFTNPWTVSATSGDYSGVPIGTSATFNSVQYTGGNLTATPPALTAPVTPQWTFTYLGVTYSFD